MLLLPHKRDTYTCRSTRPDRLTCPIRRLTLPSTVRPPSGVDVEWGVGSEPALNNLSLVNIRSQLTNFTNIASCFFQLPVFRAGRFFTAPACGKIGVTVAVLANCAASNCARWEALLEAFSKILLGPRSWSCLRTFEKSAQMSAALVAKGTAPEVQWFRAGWWGARRGPRRQIL